MAYLLIICDEYKASVSVNTELHSIIECYVAVIHFGVNIYEAISLVYIVYICLFHIYEMKIINFIRC